MKVLGIGLGTTGTRSLFSTLVLFNISSVHFESRYTGFKFIANIDRRKSNVCKYDVEDEAKLFRPLLPCIQTFPLTFETTDAYDALMDSPIPLYFQAFYARYTAIHGEENVRCVLTVRNSVQWATSRIVKFWNRLYPCDSMPHRRPSYADFFPDNSTLRALDKVAFLRDPRTRRFISSLALFYRQHVDLVRRTIPSRHLLVISYFVNDTFDELHKGTVQVKQDVDRYFIEPLPLVSGEAEKNSLQNPIHTFTDAQRYFNTIFEFLRIPYESEAERVATMHRFKHLHSIPYDFRLLYKSTFNFIHS